MYDDVAILKAYGSPSFDEAGNEISNITETTVYVQPRGVFSSEFYNAAQLANRFDYNDEKVLEFQGKDYDVIRVDWNAQRDGISLVCEERVGDDNVVEESESGSGS